MNISPNPIIVFSELIYYFSHMSRIIASSKSICSTLSFKAGMYSYCFPPPCIKNSRFCSLISSNVSKQSDENPGQITCTCSPLHYPVFPSFYQYKVITKAHGQNVTGKSSSLFLLDNQVAVLIFLL